MKISKAEVTVSDLLADTAVIIATRNEGAHLEACLLSVLEAGRGQAEVIVVDDGSTDHSPEILRSFGSKIRILQGGGLGPGHARNLAMKATERSYVAFTDGDCIVAPDWLEKLHEGFDHHDPACSSVGGRQLPFKDAKEWERAVGVFFQAAGFVSDYVHHGEAVFRVRHNPTCNVMYRRSAIESVGGFNESLWPCEDLELDLRLNAKGYFALFYAQGTVEHRRPKSFSGFLRMMFRYGFAHAQLVRLRGLTQPIHLLPVLVPMAAIFIALKPSAALSPWNLVALGFIATAIFVLFLFRTRSGSGAVGSFFLLIVGVPTWLAGFYRGLLGPRRIAGAK